MYYSGTHYFRDHIQDHFGGDMAAALQQMINEAGHSSELVAALFVGKQPIILQLAKSEISQVEELVPPVILAAS